jgi:outer membrane receptor protein involved in Fe transport
MRRPALSFVAAWLLAMAAPGWAVETPGGPFAPGAPLAGALIELQHRGLPLIFSSRVVTAEMILPAAPTATEPRAILDQLLAPHGLAAREEPAGTLVVVAARSPGAGTLRGGVVSRRALEAVPGVWIGVVETGLETTTDEHGRFELADLPPGSYTVEARRPGYVVEQRAGVGIAPAGEVELSFVLQPAPLSSDEITVHPSRISLLDVTPVAPVALSREEILALPQLGGDVFRALDLQPGIAANDVTAQLHVRGGRRDEVLVMLDGQELYDAYHLKDFDSALSVVPSSTLASLDLTTGAFPASYGDRMGGVLELATVSPDGPPSHRISLALLDAHLATGGARGESTSWLVSARRGATDLAAGLFGKEENPTFWDLYGKLDHRPTAAQSLRLSTLLSGDRLKFQESPGGELRAFDTEYEIGYAWLTHQAVLGERLFVDSALSVSRIDRERRGLEREEEKRFDVRDERGLDVEAILQSWNFQATPSHFLHAGVELRRFTADYDYDSFRDFDSPFAALRAEPRDGVFAARTRAEDDHTAAYLSDRFRLAPALAVELGVRYDRHDTGGGAVWSPRADLAWGLGGDTVLRAGWGRFHQAQRAYELMVEDGDLTIYPTERAEHWVLGVERRLSLATRFAPTALRLEAYRRTVANPRPRYESLFEPLESFPEGELDRYRFEPEESEAAGIELQVEGRAGERLGWWLNYAYARSEDRIDGEWIPRQIDQRHTFNLDLNRRIGRHWDLNLAWRYHTGRPTTRVFLDRVLEEPGGEEEGEEPEEPEEPGEPGEPEPPEVRLVPRLGTINGARVAAYHRLDLRLSRGWTLPRGRLTFFADVQNLYDRRNVAGFDVEVDEESETIVATEEPWPGFFASAGLVWEF